MTKRPMKPLESFDPSYHQLLASAQKQSVAVELNSKAEAQTLRRKIYHFFEAIRKTEGVPDELRQATYSVSISLRGAVLTIYPTADAWDTHALKNALADVSTTETIVQPSALVAKLRELRRIREQAEAKTVPKTS